MSDVAHLSHKELVQAMDGEMTTPEQADIDAHLVGCQACLERYEALAEFSNEIEKAIDATAVQGPRNAREWLIEAIERERANVGIRSRMRTPAWAWAAAIAASAAILFFALNGPRDTSTKSEIPNRQVQADPNPAPAQIEGPREVASTQVRQRESRKPSRLGGKVQPDPISPSASAFMPLPYADPALPMQAAGFVRVRMQLSMLAKAGVIRMLPGAPDAPVEADVLMGIDGQPYAIRLISAAE